MSANPFKRYVYESVAGFCGTIPSSVSSSIIEENCIDKLFDDPSTRMLQIRVIGESVTAASFQCYNTISCETVANLILDVYFVKLEEVSVSEEEIQKKVSVTIISGDAKKVLYTMLSEIYKPVIDQSVKTIIPLINDLRSSLHSSGNTISQEFENWEHQVDINNHSDKYRQYLKCADEYRNKMVELENGLPLEDLENAINETYYIDFLMSFANAARRYVDNYPDEEMIHLIDLISKSIVKCCIESIDGNIWSDKTEVIFPQFRKIRTIYNLWIEQLTNNLCSDEDMRSKLLNYIREALTRLDQVESLRGSYEEIIKLLPSSELENIKDPFQPFKSINALYYHPSDKDRWNTAIKKYTSNLQFVQTNVVSKLKELFSSLTESPCQLLEAFVRYQNQLSANLGNNNIRDQLLSERQTLLKCLQTYIAREIDEFNNGINSQVPNLSETASNVINAYKEKYKIEGIFNKSSLFIKDLPNYSEFERQYNDAISMLEGEINSNYNEWKSYATDIAVDTNEFIKIEDDGVVKVTFTEEMVTFMRDCRTLRSYITNIPKEIDTLLKSVDDSYRSAVLLKRVANFCNDLSNRVIPSQKRMILGDVIEFEEHIKKAKDVEKKELLKTADSLQREAESLDTRIRDLLRLHSTVGKEVLKLMNIDRLNRDEDWNRQYQNICKTIDTCPIKAVKDTDGHEQDAIGPWKDYWNHQLYKALEVSYQMALESMNKKMKEMRASLEVRNGVIEYDPPLYKLKENYYKNMIKIISIPRDFKGCSNETTIFKKMISQNGEHMKKAYQKAETLFKKLADEKDKYVKLTGAGRISRSDLSKIIEDRVSGIKLFQGNFYLADKLLKECDLIPDEKRIDCVTINYKPLKNDIRNIIKDFQTEILYYLKKLIINDLSETVTFFNEGNEIFKNRPENLELEEILTSKEKVNEIETKLKEYEKKIKLNQNYRKLLQTINFGKSDLSDIDDKLSNVTGLQDQFNIGFDDYKRLINQEGDNTGKKIKDKVVVLQRTLTGFKSQWDDFKPSKIDNWEDATIDMLLENLIQQRTKFNEIKEDATKIIAYSEQFGLEIPHFDELNMIEGEITAVESQWNVYRDYNNEFKEIKKTKWLEYRVRLYELEDFGNKWRKNVKETVKEIVSARIYEQCDLIVRSIPALKFCKGDVPFETEHWQELFHQIGMPKGTRSDQVTVGNFIDVLDNVITNEAFCKKLTARATGEIRIREAVRELKSWTVQFAFTMMDHEELNRKTPLVAVWKDLFTQLGDNQSLLASLKDSEFFKTFEEEATVMEQKMISLDEYLHSLYQIQRKWIYLEPIFGRGALPSQQDRFKRVDTTFRDIMNNINSDTTIFRLADNRLFPDLKRKLDDMLVQLEKCQKALSDYLEEKRSKMPRFYFIGDDDLLEILGQAQNPNVIQAHLKKLFQGIHSVDFSDDKHQIVTMKSMNDEVVPLNQPVTITDQVENWLDLLSKEMKNTLKLLLVDCFKEKEVELTKYPSQILCLSTTMQFTKNCENAINGGTLTKLHQSVADQLKQYTELDLANDPLTLLKVKALILDLIHQRDVASFLLDSKVKELTQWEWNKQLRFYLNKSNDCIAKMVNAEFFYTYEYQGNAPKLVHTPLTDKCYLTLTQGMHQGYGGNPYGPAGTGKTESVKALGNALGRQVLVFNCDEGIDFQSMGRIFTGLVKCGAWGCFDEFNRLKEDQLSAVSQQIQLIQAAIKNKDPTVELLNNTIDVDHNAGIFVTMNPAGKGYGGRSKLPDNLKQLFRPVAMSLPDNDLIAESILQSEGFNDSKDLGRKIVSLFNLSKQLLTPQQHYDWGLRAMKAVLVTGGRLIQEAKRNKVEMNKVTEMELLIKAIRVNTLPKLTFADSHVFITLIEDLFPGAKIEDISYGDLEKSIREVIERKQGLEFDAKQVSKMLQLKESLDQRMGCVIVGPSGCNKTTLWSILQQAMNNMGQKVITHVMNPKSMPRELLLGHMDLDTREWHDGVLTEAARQVVKEPLEVRSWIICDGDVDPEWIESLNSVLDDNHLLTLPNGERINFGNNVNFLFETHDLRFASPATISRMGMIFLSNEDVDVPRLVRSWILTQEEGIRSSLSGWIEDMFYKSLEYVMDLKAFIVDTTLVGTVKNALSHLNKITSKGEFIVGLIRGFGGNLSMEDRENLARQIFEWGGESPPAGTRSLLNVTYEGDICKVYSNADNDDNNPLTLQQCVNGAVIETVSVQRNYDMIRKWIDTMEPFILVGPEGCGKNMLIRYVLDNKHGSNIAVLNCNSSSTAEDVIKKITQTCSLVSSNKGRVFRPREGERLILFLKDINLPKPDKYDTCMLIAFLQQLCTFHGFYNSDLEFLGLENIQIVASINPSTTVGRHVLSTRFTAIVRIAYLDYPPKDELQLVYSKYIHSALTEIATKDPKWNSLDNAMRLAQTMVELYSDIKSQFSIDDNRHYLFTPRDLTKWIQGLTRYDTKNENILDIVIHEINRLFRDRLIDEDSMSKFDSLVVGIFRSQWKYSSELGDSFFTTLDTSNGIDLSFDGSARLKRVNKNDFIELVTHGITQYEREEADLNIKLFPEVIESISKIDRTLSQKAGSILLVGSAGVGRRSLVNLVSHMQRATLYTPPIVRDFTFKMFCDRLKEPFQKAAVDNENVILFLEDYQLEQMSVLESMNSLLSSGEVPGMYTHEELEPLLGQIKEQMNDDNTNTFKNPSEYFIHKIKQNLHIVISMNPSDSAFLRKCESNPALTNYCTIIWMGNWKQASMHELPNLLLPELIKGYEKPEELVNLLCSIHNSVKSTPREYISFLNSYRDLYNLQFEKVNSEKENLKSGLTKLQDAAKHVDKLSTEAIEQRKLLSQNQAEADQAMTKITEALQEANVRRSDVEKLQNSLAVEEEEMTKHKAGIEEELKDVQPQLDAAKKAVGAIKSDNLNEIKSFKIPPEPIVDVLSAVLMLLGIKDTSWMSMKRFLGAHGVKDQILNFKADCMTNDIRKSCLKLVKAKASSFEQENIYRASVAAAPMAAWVKANLRYSIVLEKIGPLREELKKAEAALQASKQKLEENETELKNIDEKVAKLKDDFAKKTREAEVLKLKLTETENTLNKAQNLLGKLSGEQKRWENKTNDLTSELKSLGKKMLLAAGYTTYMGKLSEDKRSEVLKQWLSITEFNSFDFMRTLSSESELLIWKSEGLPGDDLSMQNAIIIMNNRERVPFIIDPAGASTVWLENHITLEKQNAKSKESALEVINSQDPRFANRVELSIRFGKTLIINDVDGIEPMLYPLVKKQFTHQGPRLTVLVGDHLTDYHENFVLYLITRNPQPILPPDAAAIIEEINFTVTRSGLEGQLLGVTIQHEQPKLEQQKSEMLKKEEDLKVQLSGLEKKLLESLAKSEGNLLENTSLIESLTVIKSKSEEISNALAESAKSSEELDKQRNFYLPFAQNGSKLYFLVQQLKHIDHMYQFSLASFISLFQKTLDEKMDAKNLESRIQLLTPKLINRILVYIARSLFKEHQLLWALHLIHGMKSELFEPNEFSVFTGEIVPDVSQASNTRGIPGWIPHERIAQFNLLKGQFSNLASKADFNDADMWKNWFNNAECEKNFPSKVIRKVSPFQRLLITQALRPDRLLTAMNIFANETLNVDAVSPPPMTIADIYNKESSNTTPILIITTAGADPSSELSEFAYSQIGVDRYKELAMGGGQQELAMNMLKEAAKEGEWLCLKNLHLVVAWLPILEKTLNSLEPHENFRLWLTTESHSEFPSILLQQSYKITFESPPGIKKNLQRSLSTWKDKEILNSKPIKPQLMFLLAWFHAIIQERRTYIPQGWSTFYEFSSADLRTANNIISMVLDQNSDEISIKTIHGLFENAVYGSRISNPYDLKVLNAYISQLFSSNMIDPNNTNKTIMSGFTLPNSNNPNDYKKLLISLSDNDNPNLFGLPPNIERSLQRVTSSHIAEQLSHLSRIDISTTGFDREQWRQQLEPLFTTWNSQSESSKNVLTSISNQFKKDPKNYSPIENFVKLEYDKIHNLILKVSKGLRNVKDVIGGNQLLTPEIQSLASCLLKGEVPSKWYNEWEGPEKIASWISGIIKKKIAVTEWFQRMMNNSLLNQAIDLSDILHPGTFLQVICQQTARDLKVPMDSLKMASYWSNSKATKKSICITVQGLLLQGALFDGVKLCSPSNDSSDVTSAPQCTIAFVKNDDPDIISMSRNLVLPVYFDSSREQVLTQLYIPCSEEKEKWIISGAAMFLLDKD